MKWPGLKIYEFTNPWTCFTIHPSPWHLPRRCLLQLESLLAIPASSDPAPVGCHPAQQQPVGVLAAQFQCAVPGQPFHPWLTQPFTSSACRSMQPSGLGCQGAGKMNMQKTIFFFKLYQGLGLGFFSGLLYLWVESCDSVTVSPQCYKFLHRWWLYQLVVFYIHTAFSIKGVGIGFHL